MLRDGDVIAAVGERIDSVEAQLDPHPDTGVDIEPVSRLNPEGGGAADDPERLVDLIRVTLDCGAGGTVTRVMQLPLYAAQTLEDLRPVFSSRCAAVLPFFSVQSMSLQSRTRGRFDADSYYLLSPLQVKAARVLRDGDIIMLFQSRA